MYLKNNAPLFLKNRLKSVLFLLVALITVPSCASNLSPSFSDEPRYTERGYLIKEGYPTWFLNPGLDNHLGAVGIAKPQKKGGHLAQKRVALTIANAELAKQRETTVKSEVSRHEELRSIQGQESYSTRYESQSISEAYGAIRNSSVKDEWLNPKTGELYLWVVINK